MKTISLRTLEDANACSRGSKFWREHLGDREWTTEELASYFGKSEVRPDFRAVSWLIASFDYCQTDTWLDFYKSLAPSFRDVAALISDCPFCQTHEMLQFYLSLSPSTSNVRWFVSSCENIPSVDFKSHLNELQ